MSMRQSMDLTITALAAHGAAHPHWIVAWSGGKDSTALVTLLPYLLDAGRVPRPTSLTVLYADTRLELLPLWLSARAVGEQLQERGIDVRTVTAPMDKRFLVYVLGRGVPPPNNTTLRWCTRQIKVDPMRAEIARMVATRGAALVLTGVRLGESAVRDQRVHASCARGDGECGQGWYQRDLAERGHATLAPLLHWRVCHVFEWLRHWAPAVEYGDWDTSLLAEVYGGDEAEEVNARTGCVGCPLATQDTALDALLQRPSWAYLAPIKRLRPLWRWARLPAQRLRQPGGETRADGTLVDNQHRMGPLTLAARRSLLDGVLSVQDDINTRAATERRPTVDLLNAEERSRILELIDAGTWPQRWTGEEPGAEEPFDEGTEPLFRALEAT
jgi:DNA sulfur modification protein DndC